MVEGWKWIEVAPDFPYGHTYGLRRVHGAPMPLTAEEEAARDAAQAEYDHLSEEHDGVEELPDAIDERFGETWMRTERARMSKHAPVAKAMDYMLTRWDAFTRFLADGRICLTNNSAERALRGVALGRKAWLFAGSDRGGQRAAVMYGLSAPRN